MFVTIRLELGSPNGELRTEPEHELENRALGRVNSRFYRLALIFQIRFDASSETSSEPSRATVTPTGRPHTSIGDPFSPVIVRKPPRKSSSGPGFPLFIGKNTTL